ncbi:MAG: TOBE domain-containing protein [Bacilli bacterium]
MQSELNNVNDIVHNQSHDIIFGIRPEAIEETTKDKSDFFEAKVEICELLGDEYFIHFTYGNTPILAKVPCKNTLWSKGDKIILRIVRHKIHLFDPASTLTII